MFAGAKDLPRLQALQRERTWAPRWAMKQVSQMTILVAALQDGRVSFAALDVFAVEPLPQDSPLWGMENVVIAPHTGALNPQEDRLIAEMFAENARRLLDGSELLNRIDRVTFY